MKDSEELMGKLEKESTVEGRQKILKTYLSARKNELEELNNVIILDDLSCGGLRVGDRVQYTNVWWENVIGYISHFCQRKRTEGAKDYNPDVFPVMLTKDGFGYSTHHGPGMPRKLSIIHSVSKS